MPRYLIDIRMMGSVKQQIRSLSNHLEEKFRLGTRLVVPHITLAGPFSTNDEEKLIKDFTRICMDQKTVPKYEVGGYGFFDETRVVFITITPDETLKHFRYQLSRTISPYCSLRYSHLPENTMVFPQTGECHLPAPSDPGNLAPECKNSLRI